MDYELPQLGADRPIPETPYSGLSRLFRQAGVDDWSDDDMKRQLVYMALHTLDWGQTHDITKQQGTYKEANPLLGPYPSSGKVDKYFTGTGIGHLGLAAMLDPKWRKLFQQGTIGLEAFTTGHNIGLGIGARY